MEFEYVILEDRGNSLCGNVCGDRKQPNYL